MNKSLVESQTKQNKILLSILADQILIRYAWVKLNEIFSVVVSCLSSSSFYIDSWNSVTNFFLLFFWSIQNYFMLSISFHTLLLFHSLYHWSVLSSSLDIFTHIDYFSSIVWLGRFRVRNLGFFLFIVFFSGNKKPREKFILEQCRNCCCPCHCYWNNNNNKWSKSRKKRNI